MSDWKNPSFPHDHNDKQWRTPAVEDDETNNYGNNTAIVALAIKMVVGAVTLVAVNALFFFGAFYAIQYDIAYWRCVVLSLLYIVFRAFDKTTMSKDK